jgi:hypothetical protein
MVLTNVSRFDSTDPVISINDANQKPGRHSNSNIWNTPWCQIWETIHSNLNLPVTVTPPSLTVNQLWNHLSQTCNVDLINQLFSPQVAHAITTTDIIPSTDNDTIIWRTTPNDLCTAKNAFSFLNADNQVTLPSQGTRSVTPQSMHIMNRLWKNKMCSPILKTFMWRLIRSALSIGKRAGTYSHNISQVCSQCNSIEDDAHLFSFVICLEQFGFLQTHPFTLPVSPMMMMVFKIFFHI